MKCEWCQEEFELKRDWIAKKCGCDEDERFIGYEQWYYSTFKFFDLFNDSIFEAQLHYVCK